MFNCFIRRIYLLLLTGILNRFKDNQKGVTTIEYGLMMISVGIFLIIVLYGKNNFILAVSAKFDALATMISLVVTSKN